MMHAQVRGAEKEPVPGRVRLSVRVLSPHGDDAGDVRVVRVVATGSRAGAGATTEEELAAAVDAELAVVDEAERVAREAVATRRVARSVRRAARHATSAACSDEALELRDAHVGSGRTDIGWWVDRMARVRTGARQSRRRGGHRAAVRRQLGMPAEDKGRAARIAAARKACARRGAGGAGASRKRCRLAGWLGKMELVGW